MLVDPGLEVFQFTKVHHEPALVWLVAGECQRNRPIMTMNEGTVARMTMLPVRKWDVVVGFFTSEHFERRDTRYFVLEPPVVGAELVYVWRIIGVGGWVVDAGEVEGFAAFDAGATNAAVQFAAFVAGPGFREGHSKLGSPAHDVRLRPIDEGSAQFDVFPVGQCHRGGHGVGKFIPAVRIDGVVSGMRRVSNLTRANRERVPCCQREEDHIPVRHDGALHRRFGIMPLGHFDFRRGQTAPGEQWLDGGKVGVGVGDPKGLANLRRCRQFTAMALPIIDGKRMRLVPCMEQMIEQNG